MTSDIGDGTRNHISGGLFHAPVIQAREAHVHRATAPVALAQLPALAAGFTGRVNELSHIAALLDPATGAWPVVVSAVAGLAGVGKTALAVQAAHAAREAGWFPGGVLFVNLHGYDEAPIQAGHALDALLRALGVPGEHIPAGEEERAGLYRSALAQLFDPVLIIADNASSERQVRLLLPGPGPHKVIVTSRHTLAGLGARQLDVTVLDQNTALILLDRMLRTARPRDERIITNPQDTAELAAVCGGLPLALQIIAALLVADPSLTITELRDELTDEVHRLEALAYEESSETSPLSVAAAFELSYRQLPAPAARTFRLMALHPGPDLSTKVAAVLAGESAGQARRLISQLVKAHLVEPAAEAADGRWRMHDLLRLYARQLCDPSAEPFEHAQARERLLAYYLHQANAAVAHLPARTGTPVPPEFTGRADALAWLDAERPSLIAAITMAASTGHHNAAMHLPVLLHDYLTWRRRFDDLLITLEISRDTAQRLNNRSVEAEALMGLGVALHEVRRFEEAITACQDAAAIFRKAGNRQGEGITLGSIGLALAGLRWFKEAISAHQDAAAIFRETGDRHSEGKALINVSSALGELRRFEEAITACQDAAAIFQEVEDCGSEGTALNILGIALRHLQLFEEAIRAHQSAVVVLREAGNRHSEGIALSNLGTALLEVGRAEEAITIIEDAAAIFQETADQPGVGIALCNLGAALKAVGRFEKAISAHRQAARIFRELGDPHREGIALSNLGTALGEVQRMEEAVAACQDGVAIFQQAGDRHHEGMALDRLAVALGKARRFDEAISAHARAVATFREAGDQRSVNRAMNNMCVTLAIKNSDS